MGRHRILLDHPIPPPGSSLTLSGDEARHALRVKRLQPGDTLGLLDGRGGVASGRLLASARSGRHDWTCQIEVVDAQSFEPIRPRVEVFSGVPEGDRLASLLDGISQAGAALWAPLDSEFGGAAARSGRAAAHERLSRIVRESAKQCGRAWLLDLAPPISFRDALSLEHTSFIVLADASGAPYSPSAESDTIRLLVGPEGGWSPHELDLAREHAVQPVRFAPHTLRVETAAAIATAIILDTHARLPGPLRR